MTRILALVLLIVVASPFVVANAQAQTRTTPLRVGDSAPDFTLGDHQGRKATLSESRGKSPVVLVFYRGYW